MCSYPPKQVKHRYTAQDRSFRTSMSHEQAHAAHPTVECRWSFHQVQELRDRLVAESIDVCLIQETKNAEKDAPRLSQATTQSELTARTPTGEEVYSPWLNKA